MNKKTKLYGVLLLSLFLTTIFVGYVIGYHEAEKVYGDGWNRCNDVLAECTDNYEVCVSLAVEYSTTLDDCIEQLKKEEVSYKGYNNSWWDINWMKGIIDNETKEWIYYSSNCTDEQINKFIKGDYYKGNYYAYTWYDDFEGCYITRREGGKYKELNTINKNHWWNASWKYRISSSSELGEYLYYSSNCTEEQIDKFIKGEYSLDYIFYDDFNNCSITIVKER